jgi:RNA polymerase sigma-70 factor, ECF subfamily
LAAKFYAACQAGDVAGLQSLLAAGLTFQGDGGGKAPATTRVVVGIEKVARLLLGLTAQGFAAGMLATPVQVNGQPGAMLTTADGLIINVFSLDIADGLVQAIHAVVNPDKLRHLGEVADVRALTRQLRKR